QRAIAVDPPAAPVLIGLNSSALYGGMSLGGITGGAALAWLEPAQLGYLGAALLAPALLLLWAERRRGRGPEPGRSASAPARGGCAGRGGGRGEAGSRGGAGRPRPGEAAAGRRRDRCQRASACARRRASVPRFCASASIGAPGSVSSGVNSQSSASSSAKPQSASTVRVPCRPLWTSLPAI